jgi:hypothetical protein
MEFVIIKKKKYEIRHFESGGNSEGFIDYDKNKLGKVIFLSEKRKIDKNLDTENYSENPWREIEIHKQCNKLIKSKLTTNLVKFYGYHIYKNTIIIIMEKYDGNLKKMINDFTLKQLWSVMAQLFFTLTILQDKLGFFQGDFGPTNILYKKINKTPKFFYYNFNNKKYRVPNEGYKIAVSDYGNAIIKTFEIAKYEKEYYYEALSKRNESYEILLLLAENIRKNIMSEEYNDLFSKKLQILNNYIFENVKFNLYSSFYTINNECSKPANPTEIINNLYDDYISK